eukprot:scaffold20882_cov71-Phaeocystis_antarctica.AAC.7
MRGHVRRVSLWLCRVQSTWVALVPLDRMLSSGAVLNKSRPPKEPTVQHDAPSVILTATAPKRYIERPWPRVALPGAMKNYPMLQACTRRFLSTTDRSIDTKFQTVWSRRKVEKCSSA